MQVLNREFQLAKMSQINKSFVVEVESLQVVLENAM